MQGEQRLTSHFQPIVHARDTRRIFAHEALMRGRERDAHGVDYVQGYLISRPQGTPAEATPYFTD